MSTQLVVGFDLDMTLIDTRPGFAATLDALGAELGVEFATAAMTSRLGPPLDHMLAGYLDSAAIPAAITRFRQLYVDHSIVPVPTLPGAYEALNAVRALGGRIAVITGKFAPNAQRHLDYLHLEADELVGEVWGVGKAAALTELGASIYVGDHVHDVEGARAAGVLSVSVTTGGCSADELRHAGTDVVLSSLSEFAGWLSEAVRG